MRVDRDSAVFITRKAVCEPDHRFALEGHQHDAPGPLRGDENGERHNVEIAELPRGPLQVFDRMELVFGASLANVELSPLDIPLEHFCSHLACRALLSVPQAAGPARPPIAFSSRGAASV